MDFVIDNWTDMYIEILLFQQEEFRHIAEKISDFKERCNKKDKPVYDDKILYFTKVFNDRIYEKYGMEYLMEGIHNLIRFECTPKHTFDYMHLKKGYFKEKNRIEILTEGLQKNKPVRIFESDEIFKNERVTKPVIEPRKVVKKKRKIRLVIVNEFPK